MVRPGQPRCQRGMIYVALLLALALIGGGTAIALQFAETARIRAAEAELLGIGAEYRRALLHYAEATPVGFPTAPEKIEELLRDPRQPGKVRHLRRVYVDPLTGKAEWGFVRDLDRRIVGIHSLSHTPVIKREGFPADLGALGNQAFHDQWIFGVAAMSPEVQAEDRLLPGLEAARPPAR